VSRVPRSLEHLKTGVAAQAVAAARYRAFAAQAEKNDMPNLARQWLELASEKDALAILQLEAGGQVRDSGANVRDALAEERFENDVLYPKLIRDVEGETAEVFQQVVRAQQKSAETLRGMRESLQASTGDID
jgi:rubrerythrin